MSSWRSDAVQVSKVENDCGTRNLDSDSDGQAAALFGAIFLVPPRAQ